MDFEQIEQLVSLLGKSERDADVKEMLSFHKLQPLPRADQGDFKGLESVSVDSEASSRFGFAFRLAEYIKTYPNDYLEGELIFVNLFYYPTKQDISGNIHLPLGVKIQANREEQFRNFSEPLWRNDNWREYVWGFGRIEVSVTYKKDCKTISEMCYMVAQDVFWQPEGQR